MQLPKQNNSLYFIILLTVIFSGCSSKTTLKESEGFSLDNPRYGHATVNDGKKIYVLGGSGLRKFTNSIEIIDPITKTSKCSKVFYCQDDTFQPFGMENTQSTF